MFLLVASAVGDVLPPALDAGPVAKHDPAPLINVDQSLSASGHVLDLVQELHVALLAISVVAAVVNRLEELLGALRDHHGRDEPLVHSPGVLLGGGKEEEELGRVVRVVELLGLLFSHLVVDVVDHEDRAEVEVHGFDVCAEVCGGFEEQRDEELELVRWF